MTLVSIIMPAYNCELYIQKAINSILQQTYKNFELLIADDCSTDKTKEIIDSYTDKRIKAFHNEKNLGYLQASNKLFKKCTGDYITFQDADDYSALNRLELLIGRMQKDKNIACIGSNICKVDKDDVCFYESDYPLKDKEIKKSFLNYGVVITGSALLIRKEVLNKVGFYNLCFDRIGSEDVYLYSLIIDNFIVANVSEKLYYYRSNPNSVTSLNQDIRATVTHNLVIHFSKKRFKNKPDYLKLNRYDKVNSCLLYLLAIEKTKKSKPDACVAFIKAFLTNPFLGHDFIRTFVAHLRAKTGN